MSCQHETPLGEFCLRCFDRHIAEKIAVLIVERDAARAERDALSARLKAAERVCEAVEVRGCAKDWPAIGDVLEVWRAALVGKVKP
jgi:hypothetical protein